MLRDAGASNLPPPHLLEALRRPRRPQLHDASVKALLAEWKALGRPIEYGDLWNVVAITGVTRPDAKTRRRIVAAVEAAGIEIYNLDGLRQRLADTGMHIAPSGELVSALMWEAAWRWPEEWDSRREPPRPPTWLTKRQLDREYGPAAVPFNAAVQAFIAELEAGAARGAVPRGVGSTSRETPTKR